MVGEAKSMQSSRFQAYTTTSVLSRVKKWSSFPWLKYLRMPETSKTASPLLCHRVSLLEQMSPIVGTIATIVLALLYGLPPHAVASFLLVGVTTALGVTLGFHRLFTHRSFATSKLVEWALMVLGCMAGQSAPFFWIATHRSHHQHSDEDGDPHSPHVREGQPLGFWRGFWHAHSGWVLTQVRYSADSIADLNRRPDLVWINRHWFLWYLVGLGIPAGVGFLVGGTVYDALIGLLCGGLLRQFVALQITFAVNSVTHIWGTQPYRTGDQSRNNFLVGLLALGEGWHNNHHAFPYSACHGFHWYQPDVTWCIIWGLERVGLVWQVKRPRPTATHPLHQAGRSGEVRLCDVDH